MFEAIKMAIKSPECKLEEVLKKIDIFFLENKITKDERGELIEMARINAIPENSYAPLQEQMNELYKMILEVKEEIKVLKDEGSAEPEIPSEEYPEYVAPSGAHDAYKIGDKITFKGKKYICKMDNCVWSPEVYPQGWEEKVEVV